MTSQASTDPRLRIESWSSMHQYGSCRTRCQVMLNLLIFKADIGPEHGSVVDKNVNLSVELAFDKINRLLRDSSAG